VTTPRCGLINRPPSVIESEAPQIRLHDLRHYAATQLIAGGVDLRTVSGRIGHAGEGATTLRVYTHFLAAADRQAAEVLERTLRRSRRNRSGSCALAGNHRPVQRNSHRVRLDSLVLLGTIAVVKRMRLPRRVELQAITDYEDNRYFASCPPDPKSARLLGSWLLTHSQPSRPVPDRVG
jgi:hypothetical protein